MKSHSTGQEDGFIQLIILIIVALLILKFLNLSISEVLTYFKTFFAEVLR